MYAFRKPFTSASFSGQEFFGIDFKAILVASQVIGYTISKFIGIKIIAEMPPARRVAMLLTLIGCAECALVLFALIPAPYSLFCLFLNGLPLGMVFGLVLGFLEGRRMTEALTAGLCASFILADGVMKSVGAHIVNYGISETWMPCVAGLVFTPPLLLGAWMLSRIPPPSAQDVQSRSKREPMYAAERWAFCRRYHVGLITLVLAYLGITILRSIRADFAPEIWQGLGVSERPNIFTQSEMLVAVGVLLSNVFAVVIRDNRTAFFSSLFISLVGIALVGIVAAWRVWGNCSPFTFMVLFGLGLYLPYVAIHTTIFERLLAMTRDRGNIGYLLYLADAFGYLGYVAVMVARQCVVPDGEFMHFFYTSLWTVTVLAALCLVVCALFFAKAIPLQTVQVPAGNQGT
jgi:hypothetical protein